MRRLMFWVVRLLVKPALSPRVPVTLQRFWGSLMGLSLMGPKGATYQQTRCADVPVMKIQPAGDTPLRTVLYLHGGAYVTGGYGSHRKLAAAVGEAAQAQVWSPDYRLAPEHPHPAALNDALAVYRSLLEQGQDPDGLSLVGDSAGGNLALELALAIRAAGLPMPASLVLLSPWTDMSLSGESISTHAGRDPMLSADWLRWAAEVYRGEVALRDPAVSPLFAGLAGLPPMLIQVGTEEILASDALRLHERARDASVPCELQVFDGLWHVFQLHYRLLDASNQAVHKIGAFIRMHGTSRVHGGSFDATV
ncbi:MAG: alpha/beta hydrolase [Nevskiaceae bacterium]|nr:MAG: alpha/beta hydrolase [Nevskiaceae bacterium]